MMTCIACSKQQLADAGEDTARGTPRNKEAVKSLTSQIKDMVLKFSGVYRQCKPGGGPSSSTSYRKGHHHRSYVGDYDDASEAGGGGGRGDYYPYLIGKGGSSSSTPAWDFTRVNTPAGASDAKKMSRCEAWIPGVGISGVETLVGGCCDPPTMTEDDEEPKEWVAQVEPGVHITFLALPQGGNDLKRIRFSREMFNKWQAQRWWGENYDRIMELYNVQRFSRQALATPPRSEDERESSYSRVGSTRESPVIQSSLDKGKDRSPLHAYNSNTTNTNERTLTASSSSGAAGRGVYFPAPAPDPTEHFFPQYHNQQLGSGGNFGKGEASSIDASRTTTSSRDEASVSISNASDIEATEWVEQDEPGVYITIRQLADGTRELRRVRFSRERFGEVHAKLWWEENRERIHAQYL